MIHFMPFTYLPALLLERIWQLFGPVSVCLPLSSLATDAMQKAVVEGRLHLCAPDQLNQAQLRQSLKDFASWADIHRGRPGEMVGYFKTHQLRWANEEEAGAHQIRAQVRHRVTGEPVRMDDPLFEAALFLCLAHNFDQQQETLNRDLGKVQLMEQHLGHLLGEPDAEQGDIEAVRPSVADGRPLDPGAHMTRQRLESWARIALACVDVHNGFITTSNVVVEEIRDHWPDARPVIRIPITPTSSRQSPVSNSDSTKADMIRRSFSSLAHAENPDGTAAELANDIPTGQQDTLLTLYIVQGCTPRAFISKFINKNQTYADCLPLTAPPNHAVIGHFAI